MLSKSIIINEIIWWEMDTNEAPETLLKWNELNKNNAEQKFISATFQSMTNTTGTIEKYSLWLLAGSGATGALLITQISTIVSNLTLLGFKYCLIALILSAISGFIAKYYSLRCEIQNSIIINLHSQAKEIFNEHAKDEERIMEITQELGVELETAMDLNVIVNGIKSPYPKFIRWFISRKLESSKGSVQSAYHAVVKMYFWQVNWTFIQSVFFILFMIIAAIYATTSAEIILNIKSLK